MTRNRPPTEADIQAGMPGQVRGLLPPSLALRNDREYAQTETLEDALRAVADATPGWLYDVSRLGSLIDSLNEARARYERGNR